jgi:hypothetical protein
MGKTEYRGTRDKSSAHFARGAGVSQMVTSALTLEGRILSQWRGRKGGCTRERVQQVSAPPGGSRKRGRQEDREVGC